MSGIPKTAVSRAARAGAKPASPGDLPVDRERADRAAGYLFDVAQVVEATRTLAEDDCGSDLELHEAALLAIATLATRARVLVDAALLALDRGAFGDAEAEDAVEQRRWRRRREGKPEDEPEAVAA